MPGLTALRKHCARNVFERIFVFREALGVRMRPRVAFREARASQHKFHSIVGDAYLDATLRSYAPEVCE